MLNSVLSPNTAFHVPVSNKTYSVHFSKGENTYHIALKSRTCALSRPSLVCHCTSPFRGTAGCFHTVMYVTNPGKEFIETHDVAFRNRPARTTTVPLRTESAHGRLKRFSSRVNIPLLHITSLVSVVRVNPWSSRYRVSTTWTRSKSPDWIAAARPFTLKVRAISFRRVNDWTSRVATSLCTSTTRNDSVDLSPFHTMPYTIYCPSRSGAGLRNRPLEAYTLSILFWKYLSMTASLAVCAAGPKAQLDNQDIRNKVDKRYRVVLR